jgi:GNAT superfamily N-acetyltransferase
VTAPLTTRLARIDEHQALEALQWRASLVWDEYREALLAHPDAIELPAFHIAEGHTLVAERDDRVVGFAVVLPRDDGAAELDGLFVEPEVWKTGIGRALVRECGSVAIARGAKLLHVIANPLAEGFYLSCGFVLTGRHSTRFGMGLTMVQTLRPAMTSG